MNSPITSLFVRGLRSARCSSVRLSRPLGPSTFPKRFFGTSNSLLECSSKATAAEAAKPCCGSKTSSASPVPIKSSDLPLSLPFWNHKHTWTRASINTFRCLIGCTLGDFSALFYLQSYHPDLPMATTMAISMACGLASSLSLETILLRFGKDKLPLKQAAETAFGMSIVSMLAMEAVSNGVDMHLTGGVVQLGDPSFWAAAGVSMVAGYLAPLPWNYWRLRRWGKSCH